MSGPPVLEVRDLSCTVGVAGGPPLLLVDRVSFALSAGRTLGIVGESGSGKTMLVRALMGIAPQAITVSGSVLLNGRDLLSAPPARRRRRLGREIAMVFQNSQTSLNPYVRVGRHLVEGVRTHLGLNRTDAEARAVTLLRDVGISDPARCVASYPHQLSGGMRQRVAIAAALAGDPDVLIADEATTALDVTIQQQILVLLSEIQTARQMAMIMISHDLGVVNGRTDELAVMYGGQVAEAGRTATVFRQPAHRYTEALLAAVPSLDRPPHSPFATIGGAPPRPVSEIVGCRFAPRCSHATDRCTADSPDWREAAGGASRHRCFHPAGEPADSVAHVATGATR